MKSLNQWVSDAYENALAHGWHEETRTIERVCNLISGEVAEAYSEKQHGRPDVYFNEERNGKPEGFYYELVDVIIRILDYIGEVRAKRRKNQGSEILWRFDDDETFETLAQSGDIETKSWTFDDLCARLFFRISRRPYRVNTLDEWRFVLIDIAAYMTFNGQDVETMVQRKHDYNVGRAWKHGDKVF